MVWAVLTPSSVLAQKTPYMYIFLISIDNSIVVFSGILKG